MVTRDELKELGFTLGTGNWPQETWVYEGCVWVYFEPLSREAQRSIAAVDDPPAHFVATAIETAELRYRITARQAYERYLSETYDEDAD